MTRATQAAKASAEGSETSLAVSVHRGSDVAFESLVSQFETPLFRFAHGLLQNAHDAEEVVQDAMIRAHRALTVQYDEARCAELALRPWLFTMVRNLASNKRRGKRHRVEQSLEESDAPVTDPVMQNDERLARCQQQERLRRAVASLPRAARELIVLRFMEEMSYAEIGETVGATEAALRGKVFRAVAQLRTALEKEGVTHAL